MCVQFFSNLERFRLERMRLAQSHHRYYGRQHYRSSPSGSSGPEGPSSPVRARRGRARTIAIDSPFSSTYHSFQKQTTRRLRKRDQPVLLPTPEDWLYFHALPPKIQQTHFSKEERLLLQSLPDADIIDAADLAVYKFEQRRRALLQRQSPSETERTPRSSSRGSIASASTFSEPVDSAIDMEDSFYDSFRWLDEDGDLDLTLDPYHAHVAESAKVSPPATSASQRRKPSFRRTLSFTHKARASTSNASHRSLNSSQSSNIPFPILGQTARSRSANGRPASSQPPAPRRHTCHRSSSSIDPSAQYYQDPEARLKLRVYLASPQKFDEAVEFGFPSLDDKENLRPKPPSHEWKQSAQDSAGTFLDDDTASADGDVAGDHASDRKEESESSELYKDSGVNRRPQLLNPPVGRHREMTLKMTLTRPDLRTADTSYNDADDPLKLAELPPADENANLWDDYPERQGVVKKMWRKFRRRRD